MKHLSSFLCLFVGFYCGVFEPILAASEAGIVGSSAREVYVDPATGRKTSPPIAPQGPAVHPALTNRVSTSSAGLVETPVTEKPGGFKVHLGGRFHATLVATNSLNGKVATQCINGPQPALSPSSGTSGTTPTPKQQ